RTQIKHHFAGLQLRQRSRIAATKRRGHRIRRQSGLLPFVVQVLRDRVAATQLRAPSARRCAPLRHLLRRLPVLFLYHFLNVCVTHVTFSFSRKNTRTKPAPSSPAPPRGSACSTP